VYVEINWILFNYLCSIEVSFKIKLDFSEMSYLISFFETGSKLKLFFPHAGLRGALTGAIHFICFERNCPKKRAISFDSSFVFPRTFSTIFPLLSVVSRLYISYTKRLSSPRHPAFVVHFIF